MLYQPIIICIGLRYIFKTKIIQLNQWIAYFSIFTITLGVMTLIIILSIMNGFEKKLEKKLLNFIPHILLTSDIGRINYQKSIKPSLNNLKGIKKIDTIVTSDVILQSPSNISVGTLLGINPKNFEPLSNFMIHDFPSQLIPNKYYVIIGLTLAEHLKVKIGDNIRLILPHVVTITPIGNIPTQRIFKIINIYTTNTDIDNYQILINQEDGARLLHYPSGYVTGWRLWMKKPLTINCFNKNQQFPKEMIQKDWRERQGNIFQAIHMEKKIMSLLISSIILMSGFNIVAFSCLLVTEKKKEIAILKTQGLNNNKIILLFIIQGTSIGLIGTLFGILFGCCFVKKINYITCFLKIFNNHIILPVQIEIEQIIIIIIIVIIISFLATLYPARIASTIQPSKILRHE